MKIRVTKKDLRAACNVDYRTVIRSHHCLLAQAIKRQCPDQPVTVWYAGVKVSEIGYRLSRTAARLVSLFDRDGGGKSPTNKKTLAAIRKMLPCTLVLRKER